MRGIKQIVGCAKSYLLEEYSQLLRSRTGVVLSGKGGNVHNGLCMVCADLGYPTMRHRRCGHNEFAG